MSDLSRIRNELKRAKSAASAGPDGPANAIRQLADVVTDLVAHVEQVGRNK